MGSIRRKIHNDCVKMTEDKNEDKVTVKKFKRRRDDAFERSCCSATALRIASSYLKHKQAAAAAVQWVESFVMVDE